MTALLEARGLRKSFAEFKAIDGIDLELPGGGVTAVIGPNGAGKTTFINLLTGKLTPDAGRIVFAGAEVTRLSASASAVSIRSSSSSSASRITIGLPWSGNVAPVGCVVCWKWLVVSG